MRWLEPHETRVAPWYRGSSAFRAVIGRYLFWLGGLNLLWEVLQLPLYTIWQEESFAWIAYSVVHCTAGDILIGLAALMIALVVTRAGPVSAWNWRAIGLSLVVAGVSYTALSEWANTVLRPAWAYSRWMPTLTVADVELGLSPLLQWLVVPIGALHFARRGWPRFRSAPAASQSAFRK